MSDLLLKHNDYLIDILIHAFTKMWPEDGYGYPLEHKKGINIDKDICSICAKFIYVPYMDISSCTNCLYKTNIPENLNIDKVGIILAHETGIVNDLIEIQDFHELYGSPRNLKLQVQRWNELRALTKDPIHSSMRRIKDQKLVQTILLFTGWKLGKRSWYSGRGTDFAIFMYVDEILNVIIDLFKRWLNSKCKYMTKLIEIYEYYYWCFYVTKDFNVPGSEEDIVYWINTLNGFWRESTKFRLQHDKQKIWSNKDQMRMSQLLQKMSMEYKNEIEELMHDLNVVLEFVMTKYEMMAAHIGILGRDSYYFLYGGNPMYTLEPKGFTYYFGKDKSWYWKDDFQKFM